MKIHVYGMSQWDTSNQLHTIMEPIWSVLLRQAYQVSTAYSKTCVKRPLQNRQNKDIYGKW